MEGIARKAKLKDNEDMVIISYLKSQIVNSRKYREHRDLLMGVLKEEARYTLAEIEEIIKDFLNREVN